MDFVRARVDGELMELGDTTNRIKLDKKEAKKGELVEVKALVQHVMETGNRRDANGEMGATACIVIHRVLPRYEATGDWEAIAWWVQGHGHIEIGDQDGSASWCGRSTVAA